MAQADIVEELRNGLRLTGETGLEMERFITAEMIERAIAEIERLREGEDELDRDDSVG